MVASILLTIGRMKKLTLTEARKGLTDNQSAVFEALIDTQLYDIDTAREMVLEHTTEPDAPKEPFTVTDMSSANWVLRKIAEAQEQIEQIKQMGDSEKQAIDARMLKLIAPLDRQIEFFNIAYSEQLRYFCDEQNKVTGKKSVNLIHGKIGYGRESVRAIVDDEDTALAWAKKDCPEAVKESLLLTPIKDKLEAGEKLPFAHLETKQAEFIIKASMPAKEGE